MSDAPKVVWICPRTPSLGDYHATAGQCGCDRGPYVDLDWFLGEVNRMATLNTFPHARSDSEMEGYALRMLAKEIKEGKI